MVMTSKRATIQEQARQSKTTDRGFRDPGIDFMVSEKSRCNQPGVSFP